MDEEQVISGNSNGDNKPPKQKNILLISGVILLFILIAGGSYFLGTRSKTKDAASLTPTPTESETLTPSPEETTSPSAKISPTGKPSSSPTPTLTPTPIIKTKIISSAAGLDGFRSSNGGGNSGVEVRAGRNMYLVTRGFVSFGLSDIPQGAKIQEATLRLYQAKVIGNPYGVGGSVKVDHLTYGDSLDNADYGASALSSSFVTLTNNASVEWKDANVTDPLRDDLSNARSTSQFRIHFQIENTGGDATGDFAYFEAADNNMATGNTPQLVVKYY